MVGGNLPEVSYGERLRLQGHWDRHSKHGVQFKAEVCEQTLPATIAGMQGYLGSGMLKGIGPKLAERIVAQLKEGTFTVIEQSPQRLLEAPGIGMDRTGCRSGIFTASASKPPTASRRSWNCSMDHPSRLEVGIVFALNEMIEDRHVYASQ